MKRRFYPTIDTLEGRTLLSCPPWGQTPIVNVMAPESVSVGGRVEMNISSTLPFHKVEVLGAHRMDFESDPPTQYTPELGHFATTSSTIVKPFNPAVTTTPVVFITTESTATLNLTVRVEHCHTTVVKFVTIEVKAPDLIESLNKRGGTIDIVLTVAQML